MHCRFINTAACRWIVVWARASKEKMALSLAVAEIRNRDHQMNRVMASFRTAFSLALIVLLTGCSVVPKFAYRTVVEPCPSAPPVTSCPEWPVETPKTLAQTLYGLGQGSGPRGTPASLPRRPGSARGRFAPRRPGDDIGSPVRGNRRDAHPRRMGGRRDCGAQEGDQGRDQEDQRQDRRTGRDAGRDPGCARAARRGRERVPRQRQDAHRDARAAQGGPGPRRPANAARPDRPAVREPDPDAGGRGEAARGGERCAPRR